MKFQGTEFKPGDVVRLNGAGKMAYPFGNYRSLFENGQTVTDVACSDEWYILFRPDEGVYFKHLEHVGGPW